MFSCWFSFIFCIAALRSDEVPSRSARRKVKVQLSRALARMNKSGGVEVPSRLTTTLVRSTLLRGGWSPARREGVLGPSSRRLGTELCGARGVRALRFRAGAGGCEGVRAPLAATKDAGGV